MLTIFLKDRQQTIKFKDYPSTDPIKFMMNFKKIFPSTFDLLLPVLPEDQTKLDDVTWESTAKDFKLFQRLIQEWATVELRLSALRKMKNEQAANDLVRAAQTARKQFQHKQKRLNLLEADYMFLHTIHSLLDIELVEIGANFYLPTLRETWKDVMSETVLNAIIHQKN